MLWRVKTGTPVASLPAAALPLQWVPQEFEQRLGKRARISGRNETAVFAVADDVSRPAVIECNRRHTGRRGFNDRASERLTLRTIAMNVKGRVSDSRVALPRDKSSLLGDAEFPGETVQFRNEVRVTETRFANDRATNWESSVDCCSRTKKSIVALPTIDPPNNTDERQIVSWYSKLATRLGALRHSSVLRKIDRIRNHRSARNAVPVGKCLGDRNAFARTGLRDCANGDAPRARNHIA